MRRVPVSVFGAAPQRVRKHFRQFLGVVLVLVMAVTGTAQASPSRAKEGKAISGKCAACHGDRGVAVDERYPNLAGQNYQYLVHALTQFKTGQRPSDIMHAKAMDLSKKQIKDLASYFSSTPSVACKSK